MNIIEVHVLICPVTGAIGAVLATPGEIVIHRILSVGGGLLIGLAVYFAIWGVGRIGSRIPSKAEGGGKALHVAGGIVCATCLVLLLFSSVLSGLASYWIFKLI